MTRFNNKYPYTDFHELNADWLLETVKDAAAEAQEASDTVATYNDRLTTVEGDLAPIKAAMPGLASDVSDLQHDVGLMDSLITNTINPGLETLQTEVETASTGLLDRMTAAEGKIDEHDGDINNIEGRMVTYDQNFININNQFISDQGRIRDLETYRTEAQVKIGNLGYSFAPLFDEDAGYNTGDYVMSSTLKLHRARVNIMPGTADIHDLTQFQPTDVNNALHEGALPLVTSADAGDVLTVDGNGDWVNVAPSAPDTVWFLLPGSLSTVSKITMNGEEITVSNFASYIIGLPVEKRLAIHWYISAQGPGNANSNGTGFYVNSASNFDVTAVSQSGYFVKINLNRNGTANVTLKQITMT